ncbi:hypothetical protein M427DRAFT_162780 [Gonapodya prolifera JEL478]|uniref:Uncharacterized protein n=1 Tax=Gonapodya prolifera (strain JEL478) TaxID=1344416 RepID=A0A139AZQ6_GONPJ|nr:hypothetical protein M427DRAFT_162780 [Gonapodya prolifera JEL478]|eukprot:KXS22043.1 hypothetical protein M427DRAFT_162780 [Gonapodya prolifera JEL478]
MSNATDWVIALSKYIPLSAFLSHSDLPDHADDELDIDWEAVLYSTVVDYIVTALVLVATVALGWLGWNYAGRGDLARAAEARRKRKEETERWEAEEREAREAARLAEKLARRTKRAEELGVALEDLPDSEAEEEEEEEDDFEGDEEFDPEAEEDERGMPTADSGIHLPLRRRRRRPNPSTPNGQISPLSAASSSPDFHHTPTPIPKGTPRGTLDPSGEDDLDDRDHGYPDDPNYQGGQQHAQGGSEGNYIDVHLTRHVYPAPPQPVMGPGGMMYYPQHGGMVGYPGQPGQGGFGGIQLTVGGGGGRPPAVLRLDDHFPMPHPSPPGARGAPAGYLPAPYPPGYPQYPPPPGGMWMDQHGYPVDSQGYPIQGYEDGYDYDYDYTGEGYEPGSDVAEVVAGPPPGAGASPARTTSAPSSTEMSSGVESGPLGSVKGALSEHGSGRIRPESGQSVRFAEGTEVEGKEREKDAKEGKSPPIRSTASSRLRAETNAARARQQERERDRDSANRNRSRSRSRSRPPQTSRNLGTVGNGRTTPGGRTSRQSGMEQREGDGDVSDGGGSAVSASRAGKGKKAANGGVNGNTSGKLGLAGGR